MAIQMINGFSGEGNFKKRLDTNDYTLKINEITTFHMTSEKLNHPPSPQRFREFFRPKALTPKHLKIIALLD
ncbi:hypothetical protein NITGR_150018 [Nitrospina gracilis 3/211]|uniref:Uncharacterized protein n=1 Tax=Nitrospina gracilis (strain 3/211) TaxID=1266370 RepID=M1YGW2_NITG3|nr:hypothetical protein NITGR_150018 [Nitrospina gracilis 3/211]